MNATIKNMLVGVFVLSALSVLVATILFLRPTVGDAKQTLLVRFSDIANVHEGTRVLFAGRPVGEVVLLEEIQNARAQPTDQLGRVYFYQLTLKIDSSVKVYNTDEISITTSGLMGEKSIGITPKAPPQGVIPIQITDQPIYADSVDGFQNALIDFSELAANMEEAFKQVTYWMKNHGEEVATTLRAAGAAMEEFDQAINTVNKLGLIEDLQMGTKQFTNTLGQVETVIDQMETANTFQNLAAIMESLKSASHSVDQIAGEVAHGKGTLGKLMVDQDLYLQMNAILSKGNTLMNDVNHYGILFHLNKQWQRTRLKQVSRLNALKTPENFRAYFQQEVDEINSSMSRLSMVIEKVKYSPENEQILHTKAFRQDFADLLRKVDELSDNLRLYNQQLQDIMEN